MPSINPTPCKSMACHTVLPLLLFFLLPFLLATTMSPTAAADDTAAAPAGPTPTPSPELNLTTILENGGQYTTLLRLLNATRMTEQITTQLKNSYDGLTFFAHNDAAFTKLKAGALNSLTDQQQIQLLLYHVIPRYYSLATFQTASNPLHTEASGPGGMYSVNVTTAASAASTLVNVSTGVVDVPISSTLFAHFPLAVYSVDDVLQPPQMFGKQASASAPAPRQQAAASGQKGAPKSDVAAEPSSSEAGDEPEGSANAAASGGRGTAVWMAATVLGGMAFVNLLVGA